ncbi:DNA-binding protein, partial [Mycobacterium kansasii]
LTVAVSTTSGTEAITSAIPALYPYSVLVSVLIVIGIMLLNLRGMRESASFLTLPVYLFIFMIIVMIGVGFYNIVSGHITYHAAASVG